MGAYAWKTGAWQSNALKSGSWGSTGTDGILSAKYSATPTSGNIGFDVTFTIAVSGSASTVNLQFNWPSTAAANSATWTNVADTVLTTTKRFTEVSSYQTLLTWNNFEGGLGTQQIEISAKASASEPPNVTFTASPLSITTGQSVTFDYYVSGSAVRVELDQDNDGSPNTARATTVDASGSATLLFTSVGTYSVSMKVHNTDTTAVFTRAGYITVLASALDALGGGAGGLSFDMHGGVAGRRTSRSATAFGLRRKRNA